MPVPNMNLSEGLEALGFSRVPGADTWRHNGVSFAAEGAWGVLRTSAAVAGDPLAAQWGRAGLWKAVSVGMRHRRPARGASVGARGSRFRRIFELPLATVAEREGDADAGAAEGRAVSPFEAAIAWGLATLDGQCPPGWRAPARAEVEKHVPPGGLTMRSGAHARQGEVVADGGRLALRMAILAHLPAGLSECRLAWLRQLLLDAQDRWRLVRLAPVADAGDGPVEAEVDLTGAPPWLLDGLVPVAASALRHAVAWVVGPCAFLAHAVREPRALALCSGARDVARLACPAVSSARTPLLDKPAVPPLREGPAVPLSHKPERG